MIEEIEPLEIFWDSILSRQPEKIRLAFEALEVEGQKNVLAHLIRMSTEDGWHPVQRASASAALETLSEYL